MQDAETGLKNKPQLKIAIQVGLKVTNGSDVPVWLRGVELIFQVALLHLDPLVNCWTIVFTKSHQ